MTAARAEVSNWNLPNALTVGRIVLVPFFGWLLLADHGQDVGLRWAATALFALAVATDRIDGELARKRGLVTDFGKVADPIADKAITGMAFVGLSILGDIPWWITIPVLVREWGITVMRFVVIRHGVMPAGRGGKTKTALQSLALTLFLMPLWTFPADHVWTMITWVILVAAVVLTLVTGIDIVVDALRPRRARLRRPGRRAERPGTRGERPRTRAGGPGRRARCAVPPALRPRGWKRVQARGPTRMGGRPRLRRAASDGDSATKGKRGAG